MTGAVPEEHDEPVGLTEPPADQHDDELPDEDDRPQGRSGPGGQEANAASSADQPSDSAE